MQTSSTTPRPTLSGSIIDLLRTFGPVIGMLGVLVGGLFITFLGNGLTLLGLGAPFRYGLNGAFILLAMAIGALKRSH